MRFHVKIFFVFIAVVTAEQHANTCGCKVLRQCYMDMLNELLEKDEVACIEDTAMSSSTMMVYFTALKMYCGDVFNYTISDVTFEVRSLYEVNIHETTSKTENTKPPIILIDAGQQAGEDTVILAMNFIEKLVACQESDHMIQNIRWVFLPNVNPDGLEYVRFDRANWNKNTRRIGTDLGYGVDISRNFNANWGSCEKNTNGFSDDYPGESAFSEVESKLVRDVILKYSHEIKAYLSIRKDGHGILYPHAYSDKNDDVSLKAVKLAELISLKVNPRGSSFQVFANTSIYHKNGKPHCGNSVDYAHSQGISLSFEFRVGFGNDLEILDAFFHRTKGSEVILRNAYFSGLRELYTIISSRPELLEN